MAPKIAIVFYSMYGHIKKMAEAEAEGVKAAGGTVDFYQVPETLPESVLSAMHAPPKDSSIPTLDDPATLLQYDAFLFGIPTRYGNFPAQWKAFWDKTGGQWASGGFWGKYAGVFISTGTQGGGQESTAIAAMSTLTHHGFVYVPLGYKHTFAILSDLSEVRGGSPWGAGTFSAGDGSRMPSAKELELATAQGKAFYESVSKVNFACLDGGAAGAGAGAGTAAGETSQKEEAPARQNGGAGTQQTQQQQTSTAPQQREENKESGPCGLPFKCTVS